MSGLTQEEHDELREAVFDVLPESMEMSDALALLGEIMVSMALYAGIDKKSFMLGVVMCWDEMVAYHEEVGHDPRAAH